MSAVSGSHTLYRAAEIAAAKGGGIADITVGDVLELLDVELGELSAIPGDVAVFYRLLRAMGIFGPGAPATWREVRSTGQRTPEELIDRYRLECRPVRDLLVDYLRERQPVLDYGSLTSLACNLGMRFWQDLERHNPGISSLNLSRRGRRRVEGTPAHQDRDGHRPGRHDGPGPGAPAELLGMPHPGAGLLPGHRPVGCR